MENEKLTMKKDRADKHPEQQEAAVQQQAVRLTRYAKNLNALLKGKGQNAPE